MRTSRLPASEAGTLTIDTLLDDIQHEILATPGPVHDVLDRLVTSLESARSSTPADVWELQRQQLSSHPLVHLLHQDPFTRRCYYKPRGYAGDARMLDYIYGEADDDDSTALGRRILSANVEAPAPRAVRFRKDLLAALIDRTAARVSGARVLAVACGHLREARRSTALEAGTIAELIAFDQDSRSLAVVARDFGHLHVRTEHGKIRDLITGRRGARLTGFDLVYAAGLYDYLPESAACQLTQSLFDRLQPGGTLLIANFLPGIRDRGYMETFMDWCLIYRTLDEIRALTRDLPEGRFTSRAFTDPDSVIGFVEIVRAG
jgi:SAM-dependent methyltransferase